MLPSLEQLHSFSRCYLAYLKEVFLDLCSSSYTSMIGLYVHLTPWYCSLLMIPSAYNRSTLLWTVYISSVTSMLSMPAVRIGNYHSMNPKQYSFNLITTIFIHNLNCTLNDNLVSAQDNHQDLGVIMSCDLSWDEHLNTISKKAYQTLGLLG